MLGAVCAQIGTNNINDYFDHKSRNDEMNKLACNSTHGLPQNTHGLPQNKHGSIAASCSKCCMGL